MPSNDFIILTRKNLLYTVEAALGSTLFQHTYVRDRRDGRELDTMKGGELACAAFVSVILTIHWLIDRPHSTVTTTLKCMEGAGWYKIDQPKPGAIVEWPESLEGSHLHLGFYIDNETYISSHYDERVPAEHGATYRGRTPSAYYWHPKLDEE